MFASDKFEVITTEGEIVSKVMINGDAATLLLPAESCATLLSTFNVTAPLAVGVTTAVYVELLIAAKLLIVAFETLISDSVNPVTSSLNVNVALKTLLIAPLEAPDEIATVGLVAS